MSNLASAIVGSSTEDLCDSILPNSKPIWKKTYVVEFEEGSESELLQKQVKSDEEAFELYNDYAFKFGFGVRKGKTRCRVKDGSIWLMCNFMLMKMVYVYTLVAHVMGHNHAMVPLHVRHYIRSHRLVHSEQLAFISNLKRSGIPVADAIRVMRKEVGGSPNLGFIASDVYNALAGEKVKSIDFSDSNQLIKFFAQRQASEADFYYDVQLDNCGNLE
ncbi:protein FAR1-RELATED SEQUENCE 5-like [Beta vulgaris subsp. vulgaris]|uniref:protein FAR1-RELATED SEQUENCE 5-like n=1 Tax=Beta vulgaris subsp. vulgaris TaxID=3555 RepID=UPI002036915C|nr:protein FAR1-RELATED SEQUENCE 5-like [Beta vulgaris subsp. vulgaris]